MRVKVCNEPKQVRAHLLKLLDDCQSFSWASAWVTPNPVVEAALKAKGKMKRWVIGTHQYITDADFLGRCLKIAQVKVVKPKGPTWHPKVYAFELGEMVEIYVGSSNLTDSGLARNVECGVFLQGEKDNPRLAELLHFVTVEWQVATALTPRFIQLYRANKQRFDEAVKDASKFIEPPAVKRTVPSGNDIDAMDIQWPEYVKLVQADQNGFFNERLDMLAEVRKLFVTGRTFKDWSEKERRCVAGLTDRTTLPDGEIIIWSLFGEMTAQGSFSPSMNLHHKLYSKALDQIPLIGPVRKQHYDAYLDALMQVPDASKGWTGMGTRLLAMKRPDQFVCITGNNRAGVTENLGATRTTTNLENYWERIIEPLRLTPWYQAPYPSNDVEQEIWNGRVALMDAIYYKHQARK